MVVETQQGKGRAGVGRVGECQLHDRDWSVLCERPGFDQVCRFPRAGAVRVWEVEIHDRAARAMRA